jgi:hypothetical protein
VFLKLFIPNLGRWLGLLAADVSVLHEASIVRSHVMSLFLHHSLQERSIFGYLLWGPAQTVR